MVDDKSLCVIASVVSSKTEADLFGVMQQAAISLGFERALFGIQVKKPMMGPIQHIISDWPAPYQQIYADKGMLLRDPSVHHALTRDSLLFWDEAMYDDNSFDIMEESRCHKIGFGMSMPLHEGEDVKSMLSLARDQSIICPGERLDLENGIRVLASCLHVATSRIIKPGMLSKQYPRLTPREHECLRWAAYGKSGSVTGDILNISESAVKFHLKNVFIKLNVSSKPMAVALGVSLGLIN